jgi:hypothetical protein
LTNVSLAVGDINNDGKAEIIIGAGPGGKPEVRIFDNTGKLLRTWLAYAPNFNGGVNVATGDTNYDQIAEIVTAPQTAGGAHIRIFNLDGHLLGQFFAYDKKVRGGFELAIGRVFYSTRQAGANIIVAPGVGMSPYIKIFDTRGTLLRRFSAYSTKITAGLEIGIADMDNDGLDEIITATGIGGPAQIKVYDGSGQMINAFYPGDKEALTGLQIVPLLLK